jgi:hypothetical protein
MQQYDATLKQLFERQARGLLRLLTGSSEVREFLDVEMPQVNVPRLDLLARMADTGRLVQYRVSNHQRRLACGASGHLLSCEPHPVQRRACGAGRFGDALLAVLARVRDRQATIRQALDRIASLEGKERELAIEQLIILAGLRGLAVEVVNEATKYMPFVVDLMENEVFRERYERGLAEGKAEGELKVLRAQLNKRFGELPAWAQERLGRRTVPSAIRQSTSAMLRPTGFARR